MLSGNAPSLSNHFNILGQRVRICASSPPIARLLNANFAAFAVSESGVEAQLDYTIAGTQSFSVRRDGRAPIAHATTPGDLLYEVEKDVIVEVQRRGPELSSSIPARSPGRGEAVCSLLIRRREVDHTWAMLHHGYEYLSDEVAPVALDTLAVHPYPRAVCLKRLRRRIRCRQRRCASIGACTS